MTLLDLALFIGIVGTSAGIGGIFLANWAEKAREEERRDAARYPAE